MKLRILITNLFVAQGTGSEAVVELLADGLRRAGHQPMLYAPTLGPQADRMRRRGHVVVDRLAALPARPDVLHLQHSTPALMALAAFPDIPAIYACHSAEFEVEAPRPHPQIRFWTAVDDLCRDRCLSRGISKDRLSVVLNAVDTLRFPARSPLPPRPQRGLMLTKTREQQALLRAVCAESGISLDELGPATGQTSDRLEDDLPQYDIVFATARMALEAATVGCAVVVGDGRGFAGLLTSDNLDAWRRLNLGAGLLSCPMTAEGLHVAIAAYNPADTADIATRLRAEAAAENYAAAYIALYTAALADPVPTAESTHAATASWLEELLPTSSPRAWRDVAREIGGFTTAPLESAVYASEARLAAAVHQASVRHDTALMRLPGTIHETSLKHQAALADAISTLSAQQQEMLKTSSVTQQSSLQDVEARLLRRLDDDQARLRTELAARLSELPGPRLERLLRAVWRRVLPVAIRRPLHRWRRGMLKRL